MEASFFISWWTLGAREVDGPGWLRGQGMGSGTKWLWKCNVPDIFFEIAFAWADFLGSHAGLAVWEDPGEAGIRKEA